MTREEIEQKLFEMVFHSAEAFADKAWIYKLGANQFIPSLARAMEALERVWAEICKEYPEGLLRDQHRWVEETLIAIKRDLGMGEG